MLQLTEEELDMIDKMLPPEPAKPKGGRPRMERRKALRGIFWILDNGAKWKDLPAEFGAKSSVHRAFQRLVEQEGFEHLLAELGALVDERNGFRLYECYIDGTFAKAKGGGDGIGCTKAGKGVKIMIIVDARGLPISVSTGSASPHESKLVEPLFDFMLSVDFPKRLIGDKAYDSDKLDQAMADLGVDMISPHRSKRKPENKTQDGRKLRRYRRRWTARADHRLAAELPPAVRPMGEIHRDVPRLRSPDLLDLVDQRGFGIASTVIGCTIRSTALTGR